MKVITAEQNGDQFKVTILYENEHFVGIAKLIDKEYRGFSFDEVLHSVMSKNSILIRKLVKLLSLLYDNNEVNFPIDLEKF